MKFIQLKEIGKYILRITAFLLSLRYLWIYVGACIALLIMLPFQALSWLVDKLPNMSDDFLFFVIIIPLVVLSGTVSTYLLAKICGVFKKLNGFKKWQTFSAVVLISFLVFVFTYIVLPFSKSNDSDMVFPCVCAISVITAYLLYIFFNFLTKKYPVPFGKIGYYSSLEFYKSMVKKLIKH